MQSPVAQSPVPDSDRDHVNQRQQLNSFAQDSEWLRVSEAVRRFGLSRSTIYELIHNREIKTALIRKRGNTRGIRIISTDSLRAFVEGFVEGPYK
jgi:excisionase family DNA binding protein